MQFRYDAFQANYLTIPVYFVGAASLLVQAYFSDRLQKRGLFLLIAACPVIIGYLICVGVSNAIACYVAMFILVSGELFLSLVQGPTYNADCSGIYSFSCIVITWVAANIVPDYKLSVGLPLFESIGNLSGLVSSQLYPAAQGPRYIMGNSISAGMETIAAVFVVATWFVLRRRNNLKAKQIAEGAKTNGLEGDWALDFKYCL